jgi:D-aminopeptidase
MHNTKLVVEYEEKKVDAIFAGVNQCQRPGLAVGIAINSTPVYRKGFGLANVELPVVLAPTIRMRIASVTKHFTAFAYMLLCEDGKAGIDDPIRKWLDELHPSIHDITMRQLMGHLGGLRDVYDICYQFSGIENRVMADDILSVYRQIDEVNAPPGITFNYNNGGYLILSTVIEKIAGTSLDSVLQERIFRPIGMHASVLHRWEGDMIANCAAAHTRGQSGGYEKSNFYGTDLTGAGAIVSTVDDMLLWLAHMDRPQVGSASTWHTMRTPQLLANGTSTGYSLGLELGHYRGVETLSHSGGGVGGNAHMLKVPSVGLDIIIMSNSREVSSGEFVEKILDACLLGLDPIVESSPRPISTGTFVSPTTNQVIRLFGRESRQIASINGLDRPVLADPRGVLRYEGLSRGDPQFINLFGDPAAPTAIAFSDYGNVNELVRREAPIQANPAVFVGRYVCKALSAEATISLADGRLTLITKGRFGSVVYSLECLADNVWQANITPVLRPPGVLHFEDSGDAFGYTSWQTTRPICFRRRS